MEKRIVYTKPDGSITILIPGKNTKKSLEEIAAKDVPQGCPYEIVDLDQIPLKDEYRDSWKLENSQIKHNMVKAKELHRKKLRILRAPKLVQLDIDYQRADEENNGQLKSQIALKKKKLRDITVNPEIENASTIEQLRIAALGDLD